MHLPDGSDPVVVGSGSHSWKVTVPAPATADGAVSLDSELADIVDDPAAYAAVIGTLRAYDEAQAREFRDTTRWVRGNRLADVMRRIPPAVQADVAAALAGVTRSRRA